MFARFTRFRRFSLATMLAVVTLLSLYLGREWRKVEERRAVLAWLEARDVRTEGRSVCEISLPQEVPPTWLERLLEGESPNQLKWPAEAPRIRAAIVHGFQPEEIARIKHAFPQVQVREWTAQSTPAPDTEELIDRRDALSAEDLRRAKAKVAQALWAELQLVDWGYETVDYHDFYLSSCVLRDVELQDTANREQRIAARRGHVERLRHHYIQRNALYQVGAAGGDAFLEAEAHLGWLEAELELRSEEGRTDPPAEKTGQAQPPAAPQGPPPDAKMEVARSATMTALDLERSRLQVADWLWHALGVNMGGPPPYEQQDFYFCSRAMRDANLALAAGPVDRIAARRRHVDQMQIKYAQCHAMYVVGARGSDAHTEAQLRLRWLEAMRELRQEERAAEEGKSG